MAEPNQNQGQAHELQRGRQLGSDELRAFGQAIADQQVADAQLGAFAMAVCLRGMGSEETRDWTLAMRDSRQLLTAGGGGN